MRALYEMDPEATGMEEDGDLTGGGDEGLSNTEDSD